MEITIIFGKLNSYEYEGVINYTIDYMNENGTTHRDKISQKLYTELKALNIEPTSQVNGIFDIDAYNRISLAGVNM